MSDFYRRLDEKERDGRIARIFANRPENLHDYQGCANDAASRLTETKLPSSPAGASELCWSCKEPIRSCGKTGWLHLNAPDDAYDHEAHPPGKQSNDISAPSPLGDRSGPKGSGGAAEFLNQEQIRMRLFRIRDTIEDAPNAAVIFINELLTANWCEPESAAPIAPAAQELVELARKVIARGCSCYSSKEDDWHAESCPIPEACAALARAERKEGEAKHV